MTVRAVLWDADGVLQDVPDGWEQSMRPAVGDLVDDLPAFMADAFARERPCLTGEARWVEVLRELLADWGVPEAYDRALRVWLTIETVDGARDLVSAVRGSGVPCYLASNQDENRARYMQEELGYAALLDGAFYSCELGLAKPDPAYFHTVLERLDLPAGDVLFLDDSEKNVAAAREIGLNAEHWHTSHGIPALEAHLAKHNLLR